MTASAATRVIAHLRKHPPILKGLSITGVNLDLLSPKSDDWEFTVQLPSDLLLFSFTRFRSRFSLQSEQLAWVEIPPLDWSFHPAGMTITETDLSHTGDCLMIEFTEGLLLPAIAPTLSAKVVAKPFVGRRDERITWLANELRRCLLVDQYQTAIERSFVEALIAALRAAVVSHLTEALTPAEITTSGLPPATIARLTEYIEERLDQRLTLAELSAVVGFSAWHFARAFKAATGQSPHQYVLDCRIAQARKLLAVVDLPLAEVARVCGFASQSHMTGVFRQKLGITPGRYRKDIRG